MRTRGWARWAATVAALALLAAPAAPAAAVEIILDYTYDTGDFFGAGNPGGAVAGARARAAVEQAASFFSTVLTDTLSAIQTPAPLVSSLPPQDNPGTFTWSWSMQFTHPTTGAPVVLNDPPVSLNEYRIYVGAMALGGGTAGQGGPGGLGLNSGSDGGNFTFDEINQINAANDVFEDAVLRLGQPSGFARWGGSLTFDNDGSTVWHFDPATPPTQNTADFLSVALHEIGHTVGIGSAEWFGFVSGPPVIPVFNGPAAVAAFGGPVPVYPVDGAHWAEGTMSVVYGGVAAQETAMDPTITDGERKLFTVLDVAALDDIGWDIGPIPEPATLALLLLALPAALLRRDR